MQILDTPETEAKYQRLEALGKNSEYRSSVDTWTCK